MRRTKSDVTPPVHVTGAGVLDNSFLFFADIDISVFLLFIVVFLHVK